MSSFLFSKLSVIVYIVCVRYSCECISYGTTPPCDVWKSPTAAAGVTIILETGRISPTLPAHSVTCIGVLITENFILTSAYYVLRFNQLRAEAESLQKQFIAIAVMGTNSYDLNVKYGSDVQTRTISRGEMYDKYVPGDKFEIRYDIGLFYTSEAFNITKNIRMAKLPPTEDFTSSCSDAHYSLMGDDDSAPDSTFIGKLYCADMTISPNLKECAKFFYPVTKMKLGDSIICTSTSARKCADPSAVPVFCQNDVLIGVTSSYECNIFKHALVTRVDNYFSFIAKYTGMQLAFESEPSDQIINATYDFGESTTNLNEELENNKGRVPNSSRILIGDVYYHILLVLLLAIMNIVT